MKLRHKIITLLCVLTAIPAIRAQQRFLPPADPADTAITISLLTCGPGSNVYELEGHIGLRLRYCGFDITANWGVFDFASPGFIYRFVKGETDYSIGAAPTELFLYEYDRTGRSVIEQVLDLTPAQAARLIDLIDENLRPENRIYRYNYVKDNCATRPLAMIEQATGRSVEFTTSYSELGKTPTFRSEMRHFHAGYPWYQFGIDLALGSGLDYPITVRETLFAPVVLQRLTADARITTDNGETKPLVKTTHTLIAGAPKGTLSSPTPWFLTPMAAMTAILLITIVITIRDRRKKRLSRWFDALIFGAFGLLGSIITFLIVISVHEATSPNWLILWLNPLCFAIPALIWTRRAACGLAIYQAAAITATLMLAILFIAGIQTPNPAFIPLMLAGIIRGIHFIIFTREQHKKA